MDITTLEMCSNEFLNILKEADGRVELAGLGILAAPSLDNMQAKLRAGKGGNVEGKRLIKSKYHDAFEAGGLGVLAAPYIKSKLTGHGWG